MFIELTSMDDNEKCLINTNKIQSIFPRIELYGTIKGSFIYFDEDSFISVKDEYDDIKWRILR